MTAKLFSLPAFRHAVLKEGMPLAVASRFARQIATEMAQDGMLDPGPVPSAAEAVQLDGETNYVPNGDAAMVTSAGTVEAPEGHGRGNPHPDVHDHGAPYGYFVGKKYERRDISEVAKCVRADIKAAIKAGALPKIKTGVRISRYSGGCSLTISVTGVPEGFKLLNTDRVVFEAQNPNVYPANMPHYSPGLTQVIRTLESIGDAYRYDRSDSMTDYFDTNFYLHVSLTCHEAEAAERLAIRTELAS